MGNYEKTQKRSYLNRLKHIQEKIFDYQMQLEEMEDDLVNEYSESHDEGFLEWCDNLQNEIADERSNVSDTSTNLEEIYNDFNSEKDEQETEFGGEDFADLEEDIKND